jgi:hypothetical protein
LPDILNSISRAFPANFASTLFVNMAAAADDDAQFAMSLQLELFNENEYSAGAIKSKGQTHRSCASASSRTDTIDLTGDTDEPAHSSSSSSSSSSPSSSSASSSSHRVSKSTAASASPPPSPPSSPLSSHASQRAAATLSTSDTAALPLFATNLLPSFPDHANMHSRSIRSLFQVRTENWPLCPQSTSLAMI